MTAATAAFDSTRTQTTSVAVVPKVIAVGSVSTAGIAASILNNTILKGSTRTALPRSKRASHPAGTQRKRSAVPKYFTAAEMATSCRDVGDYCPDGRSVRPESDCAEVPVFIDLMVNESQKTRSLWRSGLRAIDKVSRRSNRKISRSGAPNQVVDGRDQQERAGRSQLFILKNASSARSRTSNHRDGY